MEKTKQIHNVNKRRDAKMFTVAKTDVPKNRNSNHLNLSFLLSVECMHAIEINALL